MSKLQKIAAQIISAEDLSELALEVALQDMKTAEKFAEMILQHLGFEVDIASPALDEEKDVAPLVESAPVEAVAAKTQKKDSKHHRKGNHVKNMIDLAKKQAADVEKVAVTDKVGAREIAFNAITAMLSDEAMNKLSNTGKITACEMAVAVAGIYCYTVYTHIELKLSNVSADLSSEQDKKRAIKVLKALKKKAQVAKSVNMRERRREEKLAKVAPKKKRAPKPSKDLHAKRTADTYTQPTLGQKVMAEVRAEKAA